MPSRPAMPPMPHFEEHPYDALLQDSMIDEPKPAVAKLAAEAEEREERKIAAIVTYEASLADQAVDKIKTYDEYVSLGTMALESAIKEEATHGLNAAVGKYAEAAREFNGAILEWRPKTAEQNDIADPIILLQYGHSLAKQVESGRIAPYRNDELSHPDTLYHDRRADLTRIASQTLQMAWDGIMKAPVTDEVKAETAIVAADGMRITHDIPRAEVIVEEVGQLREPLADTESKVVDIFMKAPERRLYLARELANQAMLSIATESHELLAAA